MQINKDCLLLIAEFEGLSLKPYLCQAKKATIGYGNTYYKDGKKVTMLDSPITKEEALEHWNNIGKYDHNFKYSKDYITLEKITKDNFDWIYYIKNNVDLIKNNLLTYDKVWEHWVNYGKYENRKYSN
jgi:GH24 family phage-related lysozyme (muramidase)